MSDKELAEFEASYKNKHSTASTIRLASGRYYSTLVESAWQGWQGGAKRYQSRIAELEAEVERLKTDRDRLDWLADPENTVGQVLLPRAIVERNIGSLRDAIDEAMKGGA